MYILERKNIKYRILSSGGEGCSIRKINLIGTRISLDSAAEPCFLLSLKRATSGFSFSITIFYR